MEGEEDGGIRLSKRFSDNNKSGEVDYKTKSGTAWSHSYLNQKPWHPLSYPNQRRKWIAEQLHAERERRSDEVAREYAQEQEFFRQTALISKKEKEKVEMMKAVSFMYVRPPGYNAESAKAAEIADERKRQEQNDCSQEPPAEQASRPAESTNHPSGEKKKPRPKDVFGRPLPTEEEFEILKNAPRLETGVAARVKPFGVEVRNVKCLRCGNYGHQSGDRECPLKDAIMPNEVNRLKRDDPLTAILAHADPIEPLKWELKQQPGMSPPRGGFDPDDPNQQIVAEEIFDEYGGFLGPDSMPDLLTNFSASKLKKKKSSKKSKQKRHSSAHGREPQIHGMSSSSDSDERRSKKRGKRHKKKNHHSGSGYSDESDIDKRQQKRRKHRRMYSSEDSDVDLHYRSKRRKEKQKKHKYSSSEDDTRRYRHVNSRQGNSYPNSGDEDRHYKSRSSLQKCSRSYSSDDSDSAAHHRGKYRHH